MAMRDLHSPNRVAALGLALTLALAPVPALAAPPDEADESAPASDIEGVASEDEPAEDPEFAAAKALFEAGVARYTAADYGAAVDLWLQAYALLSPTVDNQLIKAQIIYNVARAQQKWFAIDQDVQHLRQSKEILTRYLDEVDFLYEPAQAALEREKIDEQIAELDAQIAEAEAEAARREAELAERMRPTFDFEADAREEKRNKSMIGAGAGLTALGLGGVGLLVAGVVMAGNAESEAGQLPLESDLAARENAVNNGNVGNGLILTGALSAGVFLAAGVPLIAVGAVAEKKRKQRRADAGVEASLDAVSPIWLRGGVGIGVSGRF